MERPHRKGTASLVAPVLVLNAPRLAIARTHRNPRTRRESRCRACPGRPPPSALRARLARFYFASLRATFSAGPAEPPPQLKADCQKSVQPDPQGNSCRK